MHREVTAVFESRPTLEGAGVHLRRAFGFYEVPRFDPFLMLDDIHSDNPDDYIAGFPWHPHRGIETVTYVLAGRVRHEDSLGNGGVIGPGDVQWMTAGSGIIHSEMPGQEEDRAGDDTLIWGFQLWVNLPATQKMMDPRYRGLTAADIPAVDLARGGVARVIAGELQGGEVADGPVRGPVADIVTDPTYFDIELAPGAGWSHQYASGHTVFAYVIGGSVRFADHAAPPHPPRAPDIYQAHSCVLFGDGDSVAATGGPQGARFLIASGKPLGEPVAWRGPIVMNTDDELRVAFDEYAAGTFVKVGAE